MSSRLTIPTIFTAVDRFSPVVNRMGTSINEFASRTQRNFRKAGTAAFALGRSAAIAGLAVATPIAYMTKKAVEFEDRMSDVSKTTGITGSNLDRFSRGILAMSSRTRTSIEDLQSIAEIGGQLGVSEKNMLSFVDASNKFNVALGKDFQGGIEEAITSVSKMASLFEDTRKLNISESIMRTGSAINRLGAMGAGTSANISEFTLRMGALPTTLKDTAANTIAMGTYFEELGIDSRIASGGMTNLLLVAGKNIAGFASQMRISSVAAKQLLANDPTQFAQRFAASFGGVAPDVMAKKLAKLQIGSQEAIRVVGALGINQDRLNKLQYESAAAFKANTSLIDEYNVKNSNSAANLARFRNLVDATSISLGNAFLPTLNSIIQKTQPYIERLGDWINKNRSLVGTIIKGAAAFGAFAFAVSGAAFIFGTYQKTMVLANAASEAFSARLSIVKNALVSAQMATISLNGAFALTQFGMVVAGIATITAASYALAKASNSVSTAVSVNNQVTGRSMQNTFEQRFEVKRLFDTLETAKTGTDRYTNALKRLDEISPGIVSKYNLQLSVVRNLAGAEKELTRNIIARGRVQARIDLLKEKQREFEQNKLEGPSLLNRAAKFTLGWLEDDAFTAAQKQLQGEMNVLAAQISKDSAPKEPKKEVIKPFAYMDNIIKMMGGTVKSDVNVNISGAPEGSKVNVEGNSKFAFNTPQTQSTLGK